MRDPVFDRTLVARYDHPGPRYTSYPTAPHFTPDFREADYRREAAESNADPIPRPLSLYVHLPFCASPCFYCGCNRVITRDRAKGEAYLARLSREIALQGALFDRDRRVQQLHLGGGTPNYFDGDQLAALMDSLQNAFTMERGSAREFSVEIDPRFADAASMARLAELGFDRASFGVQDFDPAVQAAINRIQPVEEARAVIEGARAAGMRSVSVDLIYGLPLQTPEGFARTLDTVIALAPDRIALYSYAHLPELFKAQRQIEAGDLPSPEAKLGLLELGVRRLQAAGWQYIGMDHFARPDDELAIAQRTGTLQRNFQGYSTHGDCDLVGLGMSAIGRVGDCYAQNARELIGYYAALDAGRLPIAKGIRLDAEDRLRHDVIQRLMCGRSLEYAAIERRHGIAFREHFATELARLEALARDGLVVLHPDAIEVTPAGRLLLRPIAMVFDAYLGRPAPVRRFSKVI